MLGCQRPGPQTSMLVFAAAAPKAHAMERRKSGAVRGGQVGELRGQVAVGAYCVIAHLPIRQNGQKDSGNVVGERSAVVRIFGWAGRIKEQDLRQELLGSPPGIFGAIPTRVLQGVREDGHESRVILRLRGVVGV
jgi:hypothetical protein